MTISGRARTESTENDRSPQRPNILIVLADDMGFSDISCFGSEIPTPHLDRLAQQGVRMEQFYTTARCSPSRASLLTGLHPHQTGIGILTADDSPAGYRGTIGDDCTTLAEVLSADGYGTYMAGKWHVTGELHRPDGTWPRERGFDRFYGSINGGGSYFSPSTLVDDDIPLGPVDSPDFYYTEEIGARAAAFIRDHLAERPEDPFFCYAAFTAPHWPLHAREEAIARHAGKYDEGWEVVRDRRLARQHQLGMLKGQESASARDTTAGDWADLSDPAWEARRMEVYAAQVEELDSAIGHMLAAVRDGGAGDDTVVVFLSDNGGCAEEFPIGGPRLPFMPEHTTDGRPVRTGNGPEVSPGSADTFATYGRAWANVSNTPFREYKHWVHEGGITSPFVVSWPAGRLDEGSLVSTPHQLPDIMATVLEMSGAEYPEARDGVPVPRHEGVSMLPTWRGAESTADRVLCWEHEGNAAVRRGRWKLVRKYPGGWELYDMDCDRAESRDRALEHRGVVAELAREYQAWATRVGVVPREVWEPLYRAGLPGRGGLP